MLVEGAQVHTCTPREHVSGYMWATSDNCIVFESWYKQTWAARVHLGTEYLDPHWCLSKLYNRLEVPQHLQKFRFWGSFSLKATGTQENKHRGRLGKRIYRCLFLGTCIPPPFLGSRSQSLFLHWLVSISEFLYPLWSKKNLQKALSW